LGVRVVFVEKFFEDKLALLDRLLHL